MDHFKVSIRVDDKTPRFCFLEGGANADILAYITYDQLHTPVILPADSDNLFPPFLWIFCVGSNVPKAINVGEFPSIFRIVRDDVEVIFAETESMVRVEEISSVAAAELFFFPKKPMPLIRNTRWAPR